jgi:cytochrome c553
MQHTTWLVLLGVLVASGCNRTTRPTASVPPFRPVADVKQLMASVVGPAAEVYWDAVGSVTDKNGTVEIEPKTDDEWAAVRNSAYVVAEAGNLLMMTSRAKDSGDWMKLSEALVDVGQRAIRAAESKDKTAVFDVGAEVYDACVACHAKYATTLTRPNAARPGS